MTSCAPGVCMISERSSAVSPTTSEPITIWTQSITRCVHVGSYTALAPEFHTVAL